jgi:hypothetical protein
MITCGWSPTRRASRAAASGRAGSTCRSPRCPGSPRPAPPGSASSSAPRACSTPPSWRAAIPPGRASTRPRSARPLCGRRPRVLCWSRTSTRWSPSPLPPTPGQRRTRALRSWRRDVSLLRDIIRSLSVRDVAGAVGGAGERRRGDGHAGPWPSRSGSRHRIAPDSVRRNRHRRRQPLRAPQRRHQARRQAGFWPMVMAGAPAGVGTVRTDVSPALWSSWHAAASSIGVPP